MCRVTSGNGNACAQVPAVSRKNAPQLPHLSNLLLWFTPIALETLRPWGPEADRFIPGVGRRLHSATGDPRSTSFLRQKLGGAVQRGNAACVFGTLPRNEEEF